MKKILITTLLAVMALAATSCSNEPDPTPNANKAPIAFGDVATRAAVTSADEILSFGVFAQMNLGNEATQEEGYDQYINLLENEEVSRATASEEWDYDNTRYWVDNRVFRFYSYYPLESDATNNHYGAISGVTNEGMTDGFKLTFTTPDAADQDLLVAQNTYATAVKGENGYSYPTVEVDFQHALTNVIVEIGQDFNKNANSGFRIKRATLKNIRKKGDLAVTSNGAEWLFPYNETITFDKVWSAPDYSGPLHNTEDDATPLANPKYPWGEDGLLLIAQPIASGIVLLNVEYQYVADFSQLGQPILDENENETGEVFEWEDFEASILIPSTTWQPGQTIKYALNLYKNNYINFKKIDVDSWGADNTGGTIIIK